MTYVVYGLGISGISTLKYLAQNDFAVIATDDNKAQIENVRNKLEKEGFVAISKIQFLDSDLIDWQKIEKVIFAPGIPLYFPKEHRIVRLAKRFGFEVICDLELFYLQNQQHDFIGITGTNGKSTTTALLGFIFEKLGIISGFGGNIGIPCFDLPKSKEKSAYIFECSSYQLDLMQKMHFRVAALTNITPDHIDRHGSFQGYILAKKRIFNNQQKGDFAVINVDDENCQKIVDLLEAEQFKANLIAISNSKILSKGVSVVDGILYVNIGEKNFKIELGNLCLKGVHNAQNIAVAFATTYCYLLAGNLLEENSAQKIVDAIREFKGLRHRMQFLGEINGVNFVNDSKATNADSTKWALAAYDNIYWILGGVAKDGGIKGLEQYFKKIRKAYLIGQASEEFANYLQEFNVAFELCGDLTNATKKAYLDAKLDVKSDSLNSTNVLLSPVCASFDQWKNFEERGDYFCKIFDELQKALK